MLHIDHQKNRCQQSFYHDTKMSMYHESKNTQTNIEKRRRKRKKRKNCKARRQKITDNKYNKRKRVTTPAKNFKIVIEINIYFKNYVVVEIDGVNSIFNSSFNFISVFSFGEDDSFSRLTCFTFF